MRRSKRKTVWAYLDGKKLVDVVKAALAVQITLIICVTLMVICIFGNRKK